MEATQDSGALVENYGYKLYEVTYLPHYRNENLFVGPGYPRHNQRVYTVDELVKAGAYRLTMLLWSRGKMGVINKFNL